MNDKEKEEIALFKFSLIAPALNETFTQVSTMAYFRDMASKKHQNPVSGKEEMFSVGTFAAWLSKYRHHGFDSLRPKGRSDLGKPRRIDSCIRSRIHELKDEFPYITNTMVRQSLIKEGLMDASVSLSTIDRYIKGSILPKLPVVHQGKDRRAFEMGHANDCWQADTSYLYKWKGKRVYLISILDDASRLNVGYGLSYEDDAVNFQIVLKKALSAYGRPSMLYVDHGSPYANQQLELICARLGIILLHAPVRDGSAKGKIERSFRTHKNNWMRVSDWNLFQSLDDIILSFQDYIRENYTNKVHSSLGVTPMQRFHIDSQRIKYINEEALYTAFLHQFERKVRTDSTIALHKMFYEVPSHLITQRVTVLLDPCDTGKAYILDNEKSIPIKPVKKIDNAHVKRKKMIDFVEEGA